MKYKVSLDIWIDVDEKTRLGLETIDQIRQFLLTCEGVESFDWNNITQEE